MKINWDDIFSTIYFYLLLISVMLTLGSPLLIVNWFVGSLGNG